jgi:hypothetical protein
VIGGFFHISAALFLAFRLTAQTPPELSDKAEILIRAGKTQDALAVLERLPPRSGPWRPIACSRWWRVFIQAASCGKMELWRPKLPMSVLTGWST